MYFRSSCLGEFCWVHITESPLWMWMPSFLGHTMYWFMRSNFYIILHFWNFYVILLYVTYVILYFCDFYIILLYVTYVILYFCDLHNSALCKLCNSAFCDFYVILCDLTLMLPTLCMEYADCQNTVIIFLISHPVLPYQQESPMYWIVSV